MEKDVHVVNPLVLDDLYAAFEAADNIVLKKYIEKLSVYFPFPHPRFPSYLCQELFLFHRSLAEQCLEQ